MATKYDEEEEYSDEEEEEEGGRNAIDPTVDPRVEVDRALANYSHLCLPEEIKKLSALKKMPRNAYCTGLRIKIETLNRIANNNRSKGGNKSRKSRKHKSRKHKSRKHKSRKHKSRKHKSRKH